MRKLKPSPQTLVQSLSDTTGNSVGVNNMNTVEEIAPADPTNATFNTSSQNFGKFPVLLIQNGVENPQAAVFPDKTVLAKALLAGDSRLGLIERGGNVKSPVWKTFRVITYEGERTNHIACFKCLQVYRYDSHHMGTSNLYRHKCVNHDEDNGKESEENMTVIEDNDWTLSDLKDKYLNSGTDAVNRALSSFAMEYVRECASQFASVSGTTGDSNINSPMTAANSAQLAKKMVVRGPSDSSHGNANTWLNDTSNGLQQSSPVPINTNSPTGEEDLSTQSSPPPSLLANYNLNMNTLLNSNIIGTEFISPNAMNHHLMVKNSRPNTPHTFSTSRNDRLSASSGLFNGKNHGTIAQSSRLVSPYPRASGNSKNPGARQNNTLNRHLNRIKAQALRRSSNGHHNGIQQQHNILSYQGSHYNNQTNLENISSHTNNNNNHLALHDDNKNVDSPQEKSDKKYAWDSNNYFSNSSLMLNYPFVSSNRSNVTHNETDTSSNSGVAGGHLNQLYTQYFQKFYEQQRKQYSNLFAAGKATHISLNESSSNPDSPHPLLEDNNNNSVVEMSMLPTINNTNNDSGFDVLQQAEDMKSNFKSDIGSYNYLKSGGTTFLNPLNIQELLKRIASSSQNLQSQKLEKSAGNFNGPSCITNESNLVFSGLTNNSIEEDVGRYESKGNFNFIDSNGKSTQNNLDTTNSNEKSLLFWKKIATLGLLRDFVHEAQTRLETLCCVIEALTYPQGFKNTQQVFDILPPEAARRLSQITNILDLNHILRGLFNDYWQKIRLEQDKNRKQLSDLKRKLEQEQSKSESLRKKNAFFKELLADHEIISSTTREEEQRIDQFKDIEQSLDLDLDEPPGFTSPNVVIKNVATTFPIQNFSALLPSAQRSVMHNKSKLNVNNPSHDDKNITLKTPSIKLLSKPLLEDSLELSNKQQQSNNNAPLSQIYSTEPGNDAYANSTMTTKIPNEVQEPINEQISEKQFSFDTGNEEVTQSCKLERDSDFPKIDQEMEIFLNPCESVQVPFNVPQSLNGQSIQNIEDLNHTPNSILADFQINCDDINNDQLKITELVPKNDDNELASSVLLPKFDHALNDTREQMDTQNLEEPISQDCAGHVNSNPELAPILIITTTSNEPTCTLNTTFDETPMLSQTIKMET